MIVPLIFGRDLISDPNETTVSTYIVPPYDWPPYNASPVVTAAMMAFSDADLYLAGGNAGRGFVRLWFSRGIARDRHKHNSGQQQRQDHQFFIHFSSP